MTPLKIIPVTRAYIHPGSQSRLISSKVPRHSSSSRLQFISPSLSPKSHKPAISGTLAPFPSHQLSTSAEMGSLGSPEALPYWQVNVPLEEREEECPPYLQNHKDKDIEILGTPDSEYELLSWPELQDHIRNNRLDIFQRTPSDLRRYCAFNYKTKLKYGSIMNFILGNKLHWQHPIVADGRPFEKESDLKVKWNDWPYGVDPRIVHLVVWTKFALEDDLVTGDLTDAQRKQIDDYVETTFRLRCGKDNVRLSIFLKP